MTPHKCPVCDWAGLVSRPPWVPGDIRTWDATMITDYECPACKGEKIVWEPTP